MLDLSLTESQEMLRGTARELLAKECPSPLVRAMEQDALGYPPELWRQMGEVGWLSLPFPEAYGGIGGTMVDLALICEELGRALAPVPYQSTVVQAGQAILLAGSDAQKRRYLPRIGQGDLVATVADLEPGKGYDPRFIETRAEKVDGRYALNGTKLLVDWAHTADEILTLARTGQAGPNGNDGITMFLVHRDTPGMSISPIQTISDSRTYAVVLDSVEVPSERIVGPLDGGWDAFQSTRQRAVVAQCAEMLGAAAAAHEMSLQYAKDRVAFGRPIGAFQAIQHKLVQMQTDLDGSRVATYYAAWRLDGGLPADFEVSVAKAWSSQAFTEICFEGHEIHAGIAFMREHDLQLYYRRAKAAELKLGDTRSQRAAIAGMLARREHRFP